MNYNCKQSKIIFSFFFTFLNITKGSSILERTLRVILDGLPSLLHNPWVNQRVSMIYIYIYIMCLSVCLYPPNVKTSKRSGPKCLIIWPQRRFMNAQNYTKKSSGHKLNFFNPCIFATRSRRHLLFQTMNSVWSNNISLKF